jgi:hypothetical protein
MFKERDGMASYCLNILTIGERRLFIISPTRFFWGGGSVCITSRTISMPWDFGWVFRGPSITLGYVSIGGMAGLCVWVFIDWSLGAVVVSVFACPRDTVFIL